MRVLIIKTSSMGDILHTFPALTDASHAIPSVQFDWVIEEDFSQIPTWNLHVNQVISVAIRRWSKHWFGTQERKERKKFKNTIKSKYYDVIIDAQGLIKSAFFITRFANGTKHGLNKFSAREPLSSLWYNKTHHISKHQHAIEIIRELFAKSLEYKKPNTKASFEISKLFLMNKNKMLPSKPYLIFLHSTTNPNKHWPEKYWRELITNLQESKFYIKLPWYKKNEYQRAKRLAEGFKKVEILPKLTLEEMAHQLMHASAIISLDTGLSHLASILNQPNITLYGPTNPELIGRYGKNQIALLAKNHDLKELPAKKILTKLKNILTKKNKCFTF